MSGDWQLRRAGPADAAALALVGGAAFLETYARILAGADLLAHAGEKLTAAAFAGFLARPDATAIIAEHQPGGAPIGYATLDPSELLLARPNDLELRRLYVLAPWHGSGLGAALLGAALEAGRQAGARRLLLGVYHGNARARRFYERQGFAVVGERPFTVGAVTHVDPVYALGL